MGRRSRGAAPARAVTTVVARPGRSTGTTTAKPATSPTGPSPSRSRSPLARWWDQERTSRRRDGSRRPGTTAWAARGRYGQGRAGSVARHAAPGVCSTTPRRVACCGVGLVPPCRRCGRCERKRPGEPGARGTGTAAGPHRHQPATGRDVDLTPQHDGRIVADVVAEWARRHGQPFTLTLTGPAGGTFQAGQDGPELTLDAVEFCRILSGRASGDGLLSTAVPF